MKRILSIFMIVIFICSIYISTYAEDKKAVNLQLENNGIKFSDVNLESAIRTAINKPNGDILAKDLKNIKKLHADNKNISNLDGIENLTNLEELFLKENNITKITQLSGLTRLKSLNLWRNNIIDITPLKNLRNLEILDLDSNKIESIQPLEGLSNLKALRLGSNRLTDIKALANLRKLEYLCLWANRVADISPIGNLENLKRLRLAYNEIEDISPLANLKSLENINLFSNNIKNIGPLSNLINLKSVYLMKNEISDITSLSNLEKLESLRLDDNNISNIWKLVKLTNLKLLTLSNNNITNIDSLREMKKIEYLDLESNKINNLDALRSNDNLVKLVLSRNNISNIEALSNKSKLTTLSISHNSIDDLNPLISLVNLKYLDLSSNKIDNIEPLKGNIELEDLFLQNNSISKIDSISKLSKLNSLNLSDNMIENIDMLVNNVNLKVLKLYNNRISDLTPLQGLKNLETIGIVDYSVSKGPVNLEGKITDIYNDEYKGANTYITVFNLNGESSRVYTDVTNEFGEFKIQGIFPGQYKIVLTKKGYKPLFLYKNIDSNNNEINAKLELDSNTEWVSRESKRMIYKYKNGFEISDIEIKLQEDKLSEIEEFFAVRLKEKINYNICTYPEEIYELAYNIKDYYTVGTYKSDTNSIYSLGKAFDIHEACHAVENKFNPNYNISLGEGLAVNFSSNDMILNRNLDDLVIELMIKGELKDVNTLLKEFKGGNDYILSASFVRFLFKEYTIEQFRELFKLIPNKPTDSQISTAFIRIYNKPVTKIEDEWLEYIKGDYTVQ